MDAYSTLTASERAWLARHHGIVVRREVEGVARVWLRDGTQADFAIDHLKYIAREAA